MSQPESSDFDTDQPTLEDLDHPSLVGEFTEQLSDCSRHDDVKGVTKFSQVITVLGHMTGGLYHADAPLYVNDPNKIRQRQIFIECMQIIADLRWITLYMCFALSAIMIVTASIRFCELSYQYHTSYSDNDFCLYSWAEWSPCSATCSTDGAPAQRYRRVRPHTVIDMREIPPDMSRIRIPHKVMRSLSDSDCFDIIQYSPCNVYKCPTPITDIDEWGPCEFSTEKTDRNEFGTCVRYRIVDPLALVEMTGDTVNMTEPCDCKLTVNPW